MHIMSMCLTFDCTRIKIATNGLVIYLIANFADFTNNKNKAIEDIEELRNIKLKEIRMEPNSVQAVTSSIDSGNTIEFIKILPTLLGSGTALVASIVAMKGVNAWKKEFQGKKKIELSEEALALFYQARDAIRRIRHPMGNSEEGRSKIPESEQSDYSTDKKVPHKYVVLERYEKEEHIFTKISAMRYRCMAVFGSDSETPFNSLNSIINDIFIAVQTYGMQHEIVKGLKVKEEEERNKEEFRKALHTIWFSGKDDEIELRVKTAIDELEAICRPVILKS